MSLWKKEKYGTETITLPCGEISVWYALVSKDAPEDKRGYQYTIFDRRSVKFYKDAQLAKSAAIVRAKDLLKQSIEMIEGENDN